MKDVIYAYFVLKFYFSWPKIISKDAIKTFYILNLSWLKRKKYYHSKILTLFDSTQPLQYIRQSPLIHSLAVYLVYKKSRREGKSPLYYYISSSWLNPFSWFNRLSPVGKLSAHFLYAHAASAAPSLRVCLEKKLIWSIAGRNAPIIDLSTIFQILCVAWWCPYWPFLGSII